MDNVQTFANRFRNTDEYSNLNLSDSELTEKVLDEYPMYADMLGRSTRKSNAFAESFKQFGLGAIETLGNVAEGVIDNYALAIADPTMTEEDYNQTFEAQRIKYEDYVLRNEEKLEAQRKAMAVSDSIDNFVRNDLADIMNVDPRFEQSFAGQLFRGFGQYLGYGTAGIAGTAIAGPGGGVAAVYGTAFLNRQAAFIEDAEATLKKSFVDMSAEEKNKVAKGSIGYGILTGALDATVFKYVTGKAGQSLLSALKGGKAVPADQLKLLLGNAAIAATAEGTQESLGDGMVLDLLAKNLYDDNREFITGDALARRALEFGLGASVGGIARGGIDTFGLATGRGIQVEGAPSQEAEDILADSETDEDVVNTSDDGRKNFTIGFNTISGLPETATIEAANEEEATEIFKTQYKGLYELDGNLDINEEVAQESSTTVESEEPTVGSEITSEEETEQPIDTSTELGKTAADLRAKRKEMERQQELEFDARAVYIPKKYMGKTPKAENKFFNRFNPEQYTEGKFIDIDTGRDLTDQSFQNMRLKIVEGKASLETSDIPDVDPQTIPANIKTEDQGYVKIGSQIRTNLLRPDRWKWKEQLFGITPEQAIKGSIISVEQGPKHYYTLDYEVNNPVKLQNLPKSKHVQGRPVTRGKLDFGLPVGYITVGNKEHPLYNKITVGRSPYIKKQDMQRMSDALTPEQKQKNFDEWFGNSQIVQGDGSPKVVYHGTNAFDIKDPTTARFKEEAIGSMHDDGWYGRGFYFAETQGEASTYGQKVASVYLSVQNPFFFDSAPLDSEGRYDTFYKAGFRNPTIDAFAEKFKEYKLMLETESMIGTSDGGLQVDTIDDGLGKTRFEIHRTGEDQPTDVLNQNNQFDMGDAIREAAVELASNDILAEDLDPDFILDEIARAFNYNRASAFVRMYSEDSEDFTNKVKALGFDGIVVNDEYVVFEPTQIKEVRNTGLFGKQESLIFQARQPVYNEGFLGDYNNEVEDGDEAPNHKVRKARMVNYFSGMSTVQAVLGDRAETIVAVEYEQPIVDEYNKYYGTDISTTDIRDLDVQQSVNAKPDIFWTSPPCCNFSLANPNKTPNEVDLAAAKKSADTIRRAKPKVVVIENAPKYQTTKLYKDNILKALKEEGYSISEDIIQAADYGADSDRRRLIVRAVRDGEVPPLPPKDGVTGDWYARVAELIDSAPDTVIGEKEMANIKEGIRTGRLKDDLPIITMGTNKGSNRNAGSPAPTLTSNLARLKDGSIVSRAIARILMPDGSMKEVTPLMMARIMNIPDGFSIGKMDINNLPRGLARVMLGNGVQGKVTENVIVPLLESQNLFQDQPTADTIDKEVPNGTPTNLIFEVGNQPMQGPKVQRKIINKNIPSIKMSDLAGERVFVMAMDRMGVGTYRGYTPNSPIRIPMMGGAGFSHIPNMQKKGVAWAFSGKGAHTAIGNRASDSTSGIGLQYLMSEDNHIGNETFALYYEAELNLAIKEGRITLEKALKILNEKREQDANTKLVTGIEYETPMRSVKDLARLLANGSFNTRRALMTKLMKDNVIKQGMPDINKMVVNSSDPEFTGMPTGTVVSAIQIDQNDLGVYSADQLKVPAHSSYPLLIKGKGLGYFDQPFDLFTEVQHLERAAQKGRKYGEASDAKQTPKQVRAAAIKAFEGERRTYGIDPKGLILSASEQQEFNTVEERIEANEIKKYVLEKFGSIVDNPMLSYKGKKLKFIINRKHKGPAQYRFPEHVIALNPRALGMYGMDTEKSLSQVVREEIVHAAGVLIVLKNKTRKGKTDIEVTKGFFENLSSDLSSADIDSIQQVYADGRTMDEYNRGAEFFRAVIQKNVYGIITEEATLRNAENQLKYLFKQIQKFFADLYAKTKTFDPELAAIVNQTVDLLRTVDPNAKPVQQQIVMEARAMVDENGDKQITPESFTNTEPEEDNVIVNDGKNLIVTGKDKGLKLGQRVIVPVGTLLNRIDPRLAKVFRDFLDSKEGRILDAHTRAQNFAKKFKAIKNQKDRDMLSILITFSKFKENSRITEEQADKLYRDRDRLLKKYNMYNEYQSIVTLLRMIRTEAVNLGMEIGDLEQYFPRALTKQGVKALREKYGVTIKTFKDEVAKVNRIRAKNMTKYNQVYVMVNGVETAGNRYDIRQVQEANANAEALGGEVRVIEMPGKPLPPIEPGSKEETELLEDLIHRKGYDLKSGKPKFTKTRMIELISESDIQFYKQPQEALSQYFNSMLTWIEATKFAGRIKPITSSIDGVVRIDMSQDRRSSLGKVLTELANDPEVDQELLYQTFPDLFRGFMASNVRELPILSWLRQFSYGSLLVEFTSTLSQLYDMPFSAYDNGLLTTTLAGLEAITGKSYADAKDLLDKNKIIDAYQSGNDFFGDIINFGLTVSGFRAMDQLMKTTTMNAVYKRLTRVSQYYNLDGTLNLNKLEKAPKRVQAEVRRTATQLIKYMPESQVMPSRLPEFIQALRTEEGKRNETQHDLIKGMLVTVLAETQPLNALRQPILPTENANFRGVYTMKSFMVTQLDAARTRMLDDVFSTESTKEQRLRGMKELIKLMTFFVMLGVPVDLIKDLLVGRMGYMSDYVFNSMVRVFGINKFMFYSVRNEGIGQAAMDFVTPVPLARVVDTSNQMSQIMQGTKTSMESGIWRTTPFSDLWYYRTDTEKEKMKRQMRRRETGDTEGVLKLFDVASPRPVGITRDMIGI